ncbi:PadR family transcriptional regulator PadR [Catenulispora sp. GAS73]|uniref:PadR family transcriptional regulator n=1 Tax=Catenulispora sp. GAS73 TaxID=3156269 RepID=UPI0035195780
MEPGSAAKAVSQMRRGVLEFCVMALLRDGERYGVELLRELGEVDALVTSEGTIYPLLSRLRKDHLVETAWQESPTGPPRRYYRLTPDGVKALNEFTAEWSRFRDGVEYFLSQDGSVGE